MVDTTIILYNDCMILQQTFTDQNGVADEEDWCVIAD